MLVTPPQVLATEKVSVLMLRLSVQINIVGKYFHTYAAGAEATGACSRLDASPQSAVFGAETSAVVAVQTLAGVVLEGDDREERQNWKVDK